MQGTTADFQITTIYRWLFISNSSSCISTRYEALWYNSNNLSTKERKVEGCWGGAGWIKQVLFYILEERDFGIVAHTVTDIDDEDFFLFFARRFFSFSVVLPITRKSGKKGRENGNPIRFQSSVMLQYRKKEKVAEPGKYTTYLHRKWAFFLLQR